MIYEKVKADGTIDTVVTSGLNAELSATVGVDVAVDAAVNVLTLGAGVGGAFIVENDGKEIGVIAVTVAANGTQTTASIAIPATVSVAVDTASKLNFYISSNNLFCQNKTATAAVIKVKSIL